MVSFDTFFHIGYIGIVASLYFLILLGVLPESYIHLPLILAFIPISFDALKKMRKRIIGTELFVTIAAVISFFGNQERAIVVVLIIMLIAEYLEGLIEHRTEKEIKGLLNLMSQTASLHLKPKKKLSPFKKSPRVLLLSSKLDLVFPWMGLSYKELLL